jgi:hypothetical protein
MVTCTALIIYINIAAYQSKEVAIALGYYERTSEQKEDSVVILKRTRYELSISEVSVTVAPLLEKNRRVGTSGGEVVPTVLG